MSAETPVDRELIHERRWTILAVLCTSLVLVVAAVSSLNITLPTLVDELDASASELQWIVDSYALVFAGLLLPAGALGDRYGRKGALQLGLVIFALFAALSTLAREPEQLIATRAAMGVGAALIMPATLSILTDVFPPHERTRAIAIWAGFAGAGSAIGVVSGGVLLEWFAWWSVFLINIPIAAVALLAGLWLVPSSRDPDHTPLDPAGALLSIAGLAALLYAIIEGPDRGWTSGSVLAFFAAAVLLLAGFAWWELRSRFPMLDLRAFRDPGMATGSLAISVVFFGMFGMFFLLTQFLQFAQGHSPLGAALRLLPIGLVFVVASPRGAALAARFGPRPVVASGLSIAAAGFVLLGLLEPGSSYPLLLVALVTIATGMALTMPSATNAIIAALPPAKAGVASAINDTTREVGGAMGIAILGSIMSAAYRDRIEGALEGLSPPDAEAAGESVDAALGVARTLTGPEGAALRSAAQEAFSDAMLVALLVGAAVALVGAIAAARFFPNFDPQQRPPRQPQEAASEEVPPVA